MGTTVYCDMGEPDRPLQFHPAEGVFRVTTKEGVEVSTVLRLDVCAVHVVAGFRRSLEFTVENKVDVHQIVFEFFEAVGGEDTRGG